MSGITVVFRPNAPRTLKQQLFVRLIYTRVVQPQASRDEVRKPLLVEGARRNALAADGRARLQLFDLAPGTPLMVHVETAGGTVLHTEEVPPRAGDGEIKVGIPVSAFDTGPLQPEARRGFVRTGRFTRFDTKPADFSGYRLFVAPIGGDKSGRGQAQNKAARSLLGLASGSDELTEHEVSELETAKVEPKHATSLALQPASLRADGSFDLDLDVAGDEPGWFWLLAGERGYAGYQPDPIAGRGRGHAIIILPPVPEQKTERASEVADGGRSEIAPPYGCGGDVPMDFSERQLLDNPGAFGDDPGTHCSPFENPQRILGERRFLTVLRVDQPDVDGSASLKMTPSSALPWTSLTLRRAMDDNAAPSTAGSERFSLAAGRIHALTAAHLALSESVRESWRGQLETRPSRRRMVSAQNPIDWEGDPTAYQACSVAGGHILEWRVQWRSNGYSLGDVAHTLTLAPRQTRRISKVSWRRTESASRRERTEATDSIAQTTLSARDYANAVKSQLSEWSRGGSKAQTTGVAGGIGFAAGPVVIGGGAAHGRASSSSWQSGGRRASAAEQQSLRDAIRQFGDSLRRLESTVVTEVSQEEAVEGVSETLRNVNYCHALTVLYHEILRHYRVDTALSGVRECLYVPFSISPFDLSKMVSWRDQLRRGVVDRGLRWALDHLEDVQTNWAGSEIPPGRRADQRINYITGSIYLQLSIERPRSMDEAEKLEDYRKIWAPLSPLLGISLSHLLERMRAAATSADLWFQKQVAPTMAAKWCNRLRLEVGGTAVEDVDFTLATRYRFGGTVRVEFSAPIDGRFSRNELKALTVVTSDELPKGSVANVAEVRYDYQTGHYSHSARSKRLVNDLILPESGQPDAQGAHVQIPLSSWEKQNTRLVIQDAVGRLQSHLNANLVYYHKVIWWLMDRDELYMLLDGFVAPYTRRLEGDKWVEDSGRSIASVVERDPMAILGNTLVFRVASGAFLGVGGHKSPHALRDYYYDASARSEPLRISLPTDGLYAQALMDPCPACEEHYGSTDWVLSDRDPELEALADQLGSRRSAPASLAPTQLPDTIISLQNAPSAPDPSGLGTILQAVTKSDAFRDMAGLSGTQGNAVAAMKQAASLAQGFGQMAVDFQKSKQGTATAKQKLDNIKKAKDAELIDKVEAARQARKALDAQNMTGAPKPLTEDSAVQSRLQGAGASGQPVEVTRQSQHGTETIRVGASPGRDGDVVLAGHSVPSKGTAKKLPTRSGSQAAQAWEGLAKIAARKLDDCPGGIKNLGTILFTHDAETRIKVREFAKRSDADAYMLVHTVSDLIEGLRAYVGTCGCVSGIMIDAHGGWAGDGGFRLGDDTDGDGHIESGEARDFVSTKAQAKRFGEIIKGAFCGGAGSFISFGACQATGTSNSFIKELNKAAGVTVIGAPQNVRGGGDGKRGAWWETNGGRVQVNRDGTIKTDARTKGTGIWRPF